MRFSGKIAAVTGAARGIGFAIAKRLYDEGCEYVAMIDVNADKIAQAARALDPSGARAGGYAADVGDRESVRAAFSEIEARCGRVDVLINNAGITRDAMFHKMRDEQWDDVLRVNLTGMYNCAQCVAAGMRARNYGRIVNMASVSAFGNLGQTNYGAAKAGAIGFTKCLARDLARNGVTVNCIAPSYVDTDMLRAVPEATMQRFLAAIPLGRLGKPEELAAAAAFLASDDSSFITGECLVVSGGSYM